MGMQAVYEGVLLGPASGEGEQEGDAKLWHGLSQDLSYPHGVLWSVDGSSVGPSWGEEIGLCTTVLIGSWMRAWT